MDHAPEEEDCCKTCEFFKRNAATTDYACVRNPPFAQLAPTADGRGLRVIAFFPLVQPNQWCGKFKRRLIVKGVRSLGQLDG